MQIIVHQSQHLYISLTATLNVNEYDVFQPDVKCNCPVVLLLVEPICLALT